MKSTRLCCAAVILTSVSVVMSLVVIYLTFNVNTGGSTIASMWFAVSLVLLLISLPLHHQARRDHELALEELRQARLRRYRTIAPAVILEAGTYGGRKVRRLLLELAAGRHPECGVEVPEYRFSRRRPSRSCRPRRLSGSDCGNVARLDDYRPPEGA